ncbi:MAG TPA: multidrug effflux MFS transporter [Croceibacterium sp.]|nr:multidrug effflux MFS transporter [Croceibacterium sp.]
MATAATTRPGKFLGERELVVIVALLMSLNALTIDGMLPALGQMAAEFGVTNGNERQMVVAVYLLASGVGSLVPGVIADRFGRRPVLLVSLVGYAVLSVLITFVHTFWLLLAVRGITGLVASGLMVVPMAIIRDRYDGDRMARLMSLVSAVFITVPVLAPTLGQAVLLVAGWRAIFLGLAGLAMLAAVWVWTRLPESLHPEDRQHMDLPTIGKNMNKALIRRESIGYVFGSAMLFGAVFGYVNSAQQLIGEHFQAGTWFPLIFGGTAATLAISNIVNSRIVERFGARRVSHAGMIVFVVVSALQVWAALYRDGDLAWFIPLMSINLCLLGFLGANFTSIAMQPFEHIAGAASSVQTFFRMTGAAVVGLLIGQAYDGTAQPFAFALLIGSVLAFLFVLYSERGKLFRRFHGMPPGGPAE